MTRNVLRMIARGLVGVLVFAQMAVASYACPDVAAALAAGKSFPASSPLQGEVNVPSLAATNLRTINCDDMAGTMDPSSANLCAEHCRYGQQSDQTSTVSVPATILTVRYITPLLPDVAVPSRPAAATMSARVAASPPHAILHCVFRI